jgi:YjbE family integral membrane protein
MHFLLSALSIVLIDLLLAGDNALVIALAVRSLPPKERRIGIIGGAAAAVVLRVGLTAVAAQILTIHYLQIAGGLAILWIAVKVLIDASGEPEATPSPKSFWQAIWFIMVADVTMSIDNILAIAGASKGHFWLIVFGLAVSIPFVVLSSNLLSRLMDRFPALIYIGAGILGKVGGDMIMTDPFVVQTWHPTDLVRYCVEGVLVVAVIVVGRLLCRRRSCSNLPTVPTNIRNPR